MKKNKGFTLIELLAVIVILAIIALISTPIIIGVIDKARKGAFEDSAYGVVDAAKLYFTSKLADTNSFSYTEIDFSGDMKDFKLGGEKPYGGSLIIDSDGKQALAIYDKDHKWCAVKNFEEEKIRIIQNYTKCDKDIAENLIINGYGEYGDNTNFSTFTYVGGEKAFSVTSNGSQILYSDALIPIDANDKYELSVEVKTSNTATRYYMGILEEDIDKNWILASSICYMDDTLTELSSDLKDGDTIVHLNDLSRWVTDVVNQEYPGISKGFIFWNYKNSTGYLYPSETYSRNVWTSLFELPSINKSTNTITLNNPWDHGTIKAGTKVSQSNSGNTYNYGLIQNKNLTTSYQTFKNTLSEYGGSPAIYNKFRHGTKYIQFLTIDNDANMANTTTTYKNIVLKKI